MFRRGATKRIFQRLIEKNSFQSIRERSFAAIGKSDSAGTDRFLQTARFRSNNDAAARNSFERDDTERFGPARWNHHDAMLVKQTNQFFTSLLTNE